MSMSRMRLLSTRWKIGIGLLLSAVALLVIFTSTLNAQQTPPPPHWFWGNDMQAYVGATIEAYDQDGAAISESSTTVMRTGEWSLIILTESATRVSFRLVGDNATRETELRDVIRAGFDQISIRAFTTEIDTDDGLTEDPTTIDVRIHARLNPERPARTLEFNLIVNGEAMDPPPSARYLGPGLATDRWFRSSEIDAGNGFIVRIIACKKSNDDVVFGLRVDGHDDIIPKNRRLQNSITHNRWLRSSQIPIPLPTDNEDVVRLGRGDTNCTAAPLAPN